MIRLKCGQQQVSMAVEVIADNIISPLGNSSAENFSQLLKGHSGIRRHPAGLVHYSPFYASLIPGNAGLPMHKDAYTRFESIIIHSISSALAGCNVDITSASTGLVIATTKGNIGLVETKNYPAEKLPLHYSASLIAAHFGNPNEPVVISNACISGLSALITAKRMIEAGRFQHVVVTGADVITRFVFSGFSAFQAISPEPCKPYDAARTGITLGEAAATIILGKNKGSGIKISGTGASNDANHISGPSRTGEELAMAMKQALGDAGIGVGDIGLVNAHGTATLYNDEMEAKAIHHAGLQDAVVNSLKGYYGHTLGAAGILESVIDIHSMKTGQVLPTLGFHTVGVSKPINVSATLTETRISHCLKTASGFGGCNAAVVFSN
jgi:3-oxoacyl-[acyl-carrier-protein] synthase-1